MKRSIKLFTLTLAWAALLPASASQPPSCAELGALILEKDDILAATSAITPAAGTTPAYCQVDLTQRPLINIRIGLPLNARDGGLGGAPGRGAWNGKIQNLGGGGYAGALGTGGTTVAGPVANRYVGSNTDTGHNADFCAANGHPNCGAAAIFPVLFGGAFVLDRDNELLKWQVKDFIKDSLHAQTRWALDLAKLYYGTPAERNYWTGCSTGGRQGFEMAQSFGHLFDGFLVGAPAFNWNRFIIGEQWPPVVVKDVVGPAGLSPAKSAAANAAALAACDANDGVSDGIISEPRRCGFNANALLCTGSPSDPATCLTPQEANAVNAIWDGPRNERGERLWGGIPKGVSFDTLLPGGTGPSPLIDTYVTNWLHQDPAFDWRSITLSTFSSEFESSYKKFKHTAATDDPNLDQVRKRGAKIIHYHGVADPLIVPFGSYNYAGRVFEKYGVRETQSFMRSFFYPGVGHCAGGAAPQPDTTALFNALQNWVENGIAPDYVVARQNLAGGAVRTRKVCKYPDEAVYNGTGSTNDDSNFHCVVNRAIPADLAADALTNKDRRKGEHDRDDDHDD